MSALAVFLVVSIALPFIFLPMEASWGHLVFHLLGIVTCVFGIALLRGTRATSASRTVRVMTWVVTAAATGWLIGHIGELSVVLTHGGAHADQHVFEHPVHSAFATIAVPSWMLTAITTLILLVTLGVQALRRRTR
ncbi:MAG TPA: hypothetical protein PKA93_06000 [Arachnia sp.]|nr:hypothetical protein [Arachnia sp.]